MKALVWASCIFLAIRCAFGGTTKTPGVARFALCQTAAMETATEDCIADVFDWVRGLLRGDEDAIVIPEMAFTSFSEFPDAWRYAPAVWRAAADFAVEQDAWVFVNHPNREGSGADARLFNETRVFSPDGGVAAVYRKRVLANMDVAAGFSPGAETTVADLPFARIGLLICKDAYYPDKGGAGYVAVDMLLVQFSHPGVDDRDAPEAAGFPSSAQSLKDLRRSRYGWSHLKVPFAAANKDGPDGNYVLCGGTFAANSDGTAFAGRKSGAGVVFADFPLRDDGRIAAPPPFEVSLDPAGGAVSPRRFSVARGSALGRLPVPTRKGYVFLGWYTARRGGSKVAASTLPSRDTALFARWAKAAYAVSFSANGGTLPKGSTMAAQKMTYGKAAKLRKNAFTRKDCVFIGWATSKSGKVVYKNAQAVKNLRTDGKTVTLYAKWAEKTYTVAFNANGGKGTMAAQKMAYGKAAELSPNKFARPGCTFRGWAEKKTGAVAYKNAQSVKNLRTDGKTTTLYAAWAKNAYTVAFNANGGTGTMAKQAMKYGTAANLRANAFKRTGYAFQGWAKTAGGAVVCANRARVKNLRTDGGTTTLYAKWKASTYKIEFDANGGIGSMAAQQMTYGTAAALRANAFKHDGFAFQGWSRTGDGAEAYADQARVKNLGRDGGTVTLYAVWAPDPVPEPSEEPAEETASAPVAVPHEWPEGNAAGILSANGGDYEAAARAKVANGVNTVRECYVAGLDAEDAAQEFTAEISFMDGNPVVSANPGGVEGREYALYGKKDLTDPAEDWADVTDNANPGADGYRFFRVGVSLPEE